MSFKNNDNFYNQFSQFYYYTITLLAAFARRQKRRTHELILIKINCGFLACSNLAHVFSFVATKSLQVLISVTFFVSKYENFNNNDNLYNQL